jgi:hypothetical protein
MSVKKEKGGPMGDIDKTVKLFSEGVENYYDSIELKQKEIELAYKNFETLKKQFSNYDFSKKILLDIGGTVFATSVETLTNGRSHFFTAMFSGKYSTKPNQDGMYFIDRNPAMFQTILDFLRGEELYLREMNPKDKKQLLRDCQYYQIHDLEESMVSVTTNYVWTVGQNCELTENGKKATSNSYSGSYVYVNDPIATSKRQTINITIDTKSNAWCHVALGIQKSFPSLGNYYASQGGKFPFMYFLTQGTVNGTSGFPSKNAGKVTLFIEDNSVTFAVDDVKQSGSWPLPEEVWLLCDPYHSGSTAVLS